MLNLKEKPEDHISAIFDDEGKEYPEDPANEVQVDEEAGTIATSEEEEEIAAHHTF